MDDALYFSDQHLQVREMVRDFARKEVAPVAREFDRTSEFPWENIRKMGELGLLGVPWSEELGGAGMDQLSYYITLHELAGVQGSLEEAFMQLTGDSVEYGGHRFPQGTDPMVPAGPPPVAFTPGAGATTATTGQERNLR